ncbi:MAG: hypothetical protein ABIL09_21670 [Gemmatimonadota bacterium]
MARPALTALAGLLLVGCLAGGARAEALPALEMRADSSRVRLGDAVHLEVRLRFQPGARALVLVPPSVSARARLTETGVSGPAERAGAVELSHQYELRLYEPGAHQVEPPRVAVVRAAGDTLWPAAVPLSLEVAPTRAPGDEELRDIKPPVPVAGGLPKWLAAVLVAISLIGLAALAKWLLDRRRRAVPTPPPAPVNYLAEFARIATMGLLERGAYKTYYTLLSEVLRRFLEDRFAVEAMERTTAEVEAALRRGDCVDDALARRAVAFLGAADLVKFATAVPGLDRARAAAEEGRDLVRAVDEDLARRAMARAAAAAEVPVAATGEA